MRFFTQVVGKIISPYSRPTNPNLSVQAPLARKIIL